MITLTGNAASPATSTCAAPTAATASRPPGRQRPSDRKADSVYVERVLWRGQAEAAAAHLVKGQAVAFSGRFERRPYTTRDGRQGVAYEIHDVVLEYGAKPRGEEPAPAPADAPAGEDDIPF